MIQNLTFKSCFNPDLTLYISLDLALATALDLTLVLVLGLTVELTLKLILNLSIEIIHNIIIMDFATIYLAPGSTHDLNSILTLDLTFGSIEDFDLAH